MPEQEQAHQTEVITTSRGATSFVSYHARCSCDWSAPRTRHTRLEAEADADEHRGEPRRVTGSGVTPSRSFWIAEVTVSAIAFAAGLVLARLLAESGGDDLTGIFLLAEAVLFILAFLLAALLGGPGKVLALGVAPGVGLAIASAVLLGEDCGEDSFLCITPDAAFALGLLAALVLYPGWALGAGVGALKRLGTRRSEQPPR